jgi:hypothetical protein
VDELVEGLNENGYNTVGYADHIAILVNEKFPYIVSELLQEATCKGTFGKTWGLKPMVLHWIYIMIIIHSDLWCNAKVDEIQLQHQQDGV